MSDSKQPDTSQTNTNRVHIPPGELKILSLAETLAEIATETDSLLETRKKQRTPTPVDPQQRSTSSNTLKDDKLKVDNNVKEIFTNMAGDSFTIEDLGVRQHFSEEKLEQLTETETTDEELLELAQHFETWAEMRVREMIARATIHKTEPGYTFRPEYDLWLDQDDDLFDNVAQYLTTESQKRNLNLRIFQD